MHSQADFFPLLLLFQVVMCQNNNLCKTITCYGQAVCHEVSVPCSNGSALCFTILPQCSDKSIEDYAKDLVTNKNIEDMVNNPEYLKSNDKDILCQGFNCYGLNSCTVRKVACVDDPTCINYLPICDDSPLLAVSSTT